MTSEKLPFNQEAILNYLDTCIRHWRAERDNSERILYPKFIMAKHYVDAYQSVRSSIFGSTLPEDVPSFASNWEPGEPLTNASLAKSIETIMNLPRKQNVDLT